MDNNYNLIRGLLKETPDLLTTFNALVSNGVEGSKMLEDILDFLDDDNVKLNMIQDKNKISLVALMKRYYLTCGDTFIVESDYEKVFMSSKREIYRIDAPSGIRIATSYEVTNGVRGLIAEDNYLIDVEKYKLLALLVWSITGRLRYYRLAGFEYNYTKNKGLEDSIYDLILRCSTQLIKMMDWVGSKEFSGEIKALKRAIKQSKYKYPDYAADEVRADITEKQLIFYLEKHLPRGSSNDRYRQAIALVLRSKDKFNKLTPANIAYLREIYAELTSGVVDLVGTGKAKDILDDNPIRKECKTIIDGAKLGLIDNNHFAFKIISTLEKINYSKCSTKQYEILRDANNKIKEAKKAKEEQKGMSDILDNTDIFNGGLPGITEESLLDISNALGSGDFRQPELEEGMEDIIDDYYNNIDEGLFE